MAEPAGNVILLCIRQEWGSRTKRKVVVKYGHSYSFPAGDWWPVCGLIVPASVFNILWTPGTHLELFQALECYHEQPELVSEHLAEAGAALGGRGSRETTILLPGALIAQLAAVSHLFVDLGLVAEEWWMEKDALRWLGRQFSLLSDELSFQHSCVLSSQVSDPSRSISSNKYIKKLSQGQVCDLLHAISLPTWWNPSSHFSLLLKTLILMEMVSVHLDAPLTECFRINLVYIIWLNSCSPPCLCIPTWLQLSIFSTSSGPLSTKDAYKINCIYMVLRAF